MAATATVIIPARYASTRFPAKIIANQTGQPLVQHAVDQVRKCKSVREIIVAADDQRIVDALAPYKTQCVMTSPDHQSGTDRIAEVARSLTDDIIVNVQGDEPEIEPQVIDDLIDLLRRTKCSMGTAITPFPSGADPNDPNLVKAVINPYGWAVYFSRAAVPYYRDTGARREYYLHLGLYAYSRKFLLQFSGWQPTPLELAEKLEQLRAIEHGEPICVLKVDRVSHGIDTAEQYAEFVRRYKDSQ